VLNPIVRVCRSVSVCALVAVALAGCGRYQPPSDRPDTRSASPTWRDDVAITLCKDVPPVPQDREEVSVSRSTPEEALKTVTLFWGDPADPWPGAVQVTVRVDDKTCAKRPDIRAWFEPRVGPVRFENARIVVRPGQERAYVGYTIVGGGENQYASLSDIRAVGSDGRPLDWKHQTATGGPADVVAMAEPMVFEPATEAGGDAYYFDASTVKVGETVLVSFKFQSGPLEVPFRVVAAD